MKKLPKDSGNRKRQTCPRCKWKTLWFKVYKNEKVDIWECASCQTVILKAIL